MTCVSFLLSLSVFHVVRFRRQHEQLRQVIARVLRPATSAAPITAGAATSDPAPQPISIDAADGSSVEVE